MSPDIPATFAPPMDHADYERRELMIPMRDGARLYTVLLIPRGATRAPIVLTRTPYDASKRGEQTASERLVETVALADEVLAKGGYIRAFQDVRGKYGSEGEYVMTRPLRGPQNDTAVDHSTDAYDTIDWLVKNVPETNGRVGMIGSSYEGFTVLMALVHPHPALKAAVPMSPMVDGWKGDDWFHNGAFRQTLPSPTHVAGAPQVDLYASTSGTDSDWVVKLIDVYPDTVPSRPELGGYELGIAMDIFRGRYRESLEHPAALPPQEGLRYQFALPSVDHVFLPRHRIMVQIQSSWFPLYDRNPQTFVENVFFARPEDYRKATQRVFRAGAMATGIELPIVK